MDNKKLKIIVTILTIIIVALTTYIIYEKTSEKDLSIVNNNTINQNKDKQEEQNNIENNNQNEIEKEESDNKDNQTNTNDSAKKYSEKDFIRNKNIVLVEQPACSGLSEPLTASINQENDIVISGSRIKIEENDDSREEIKINTTIKLVNAKYLYKVGILACDNINLYYITNDNELYLIDSDTFYSEIVYKGNSISGKKVTDNKVVEFLGEESREYESYIKVLLEDGSVEYIKYFETAMELR